MLDRRRITGALDPALTPRCVIDEICLAHGVRAEPSHSRRELLSLLDSTPCAAEGAGLRWVARFVNPGCSWRRAPLEQAYRFLLSFADRQTSLPPDFEVGPQTPEAPARANACVLYRVCRAYSLQTHAHTSVEEMAAMVRMLTVPLERLRGECLRFLSETTAPGALVQFLSSMGQVPSESGSATEMEQLTREDLLRMHTQIYDENVLRHSLHPSTCRGALVCAAVNYHLDLSEFSSPPHEYARLRGGTPAEYVPHDRRLAAVYRDNCKFFSLRHTFKPLYPEVFYRQHAPALLEAYGLVAPAAQTLEAAYESLLLESTMPTFYHGPLPDSALGQSPRDPTTSIDFEPIDRVPYGQLFYYGVLGSHLMPITLEELLRFFTARSSYDCPLYPGTSFSQSCINRLCLLLYHATPPSHRPMAPETLELYARAYRAIYSVRERLKDGPELRSFGEKHSQNAAARRCVDLLAEAGMYMRGWEGPGHPLPLRAAQTVSPPDRQPMIEFRVTKCITELREAAACAPEFLSLPLFLFEHGKFRRSAEARFGLTVGDRLDIVMQGNSVDNVHSCIRISSCWILSTAAKYAATCDWPLPYKIADMDHIA